jgi:hypothetical protein
MRFLPHLLRPTRAGAAAVIVIFSLILTIALHGGLLGIPALFILTSWFFKYAYILFDHTVWGYDEPPTLDIQMLNPLDEQRPLAQVVILGLIYAAVKFTETTWGVAPAALLLVLAAFAFPASVAVLGLERSILLAIYPVAIAQMIRGLGLVYLLVLMVIGAYIVGIGMLMKWVSLLPLELALAMFGILSIFSVLGGALYERRNELGIATRKSPERTEELARQAELRESHALVTEALWTDASGLAHQSLGAAPGLAGLARPRDIRLPLVVRTRRALARPPLLESPDRRLCGQIAPIERSRPGARCGTGALG